MKEGQKDCFATEPTKYLSEDFKMSFNKNNPNAMGKIMGYLKQISTEMVSQHLYSYWHNRLIYAVIYMHGYFPMIGIHAFYIRYVRNKN